MLFYCTNRACRSGHCRRNVFWFHEIAETSKCAQNVHQKHIYTRPTSRQLPKSSSGSCKTNDFWKLLLKPSPDNEFSMLSFDGRPEMCLWWTSRAHLRFSLKSTKIKYVILTLTRPLFPTCSHKCNAQNGAVARLFFQKCYSHSMFFAPTDWKPAAKHMKKTSFAL